MVFPFVINALSQHLSLAFGLVISGITAVVGSGVPLSTCCTKHGGSCTMAEDLCSLTSCTSNIKSDLPQVPGSSISFASRSNGQFSWLDESS